MFALPGQSADDVIADLASARPNSAPTSSPPIRFSRFPYTSVGEYLHLAGVRMPDLRARREHYRAIGEWCADHGFERVSVWGFKRGAVPRYSSVTSDGYIGVGRGAGSHLPDGFVLNTFDLDELGAGAWARAVAHRSAHAVRRPDVRLVVALLALLRHPHSVDAARRGARQGRAQARRWLKAMDGGRSCLRHDGTLELTDAGAFWLHLAQNHFALTYVNTLWTEARREPWPEEIGM